MAVRKVKDTTEQEVFHCDTPEELHKLVENLREQGYTISLCPCEICKTQKN